MKYYLVGEPISSERLAELQAGDDFNAAIKHYAQSHIGENPTKTVKLFQEYEEARKNALSTESHHYPILTVEARRAHKPNTPTWDALVWMIKLENVSLVHAKCDVMKGIVYLNPKASPNHEMSAESAATLPAPVSHVILPTVTPKSTPQSSSWIPSPGALVRGTFKAVNALTAFAISAVFLKFGSGAIATLPSTGLNPALDAAIKKVGFLLLGTAGTYTALQLKPIRNLQKKLIIKAGPAIAKQLAKNRFPLPKAPQEFESPEAEERFESQLSEARAKQNFRFLMTKLTLPYTLDSALQEGLFNTNNGSTYSRVVISFRDPRKTSAQVTADLQEQDAKSSCAQSQTVKPSSYLPSNPRTLRKNTMAQRSHSYNTRSRTRLR